MPGGTSNVSRDAVGAAAAADAAGGGDSASGTRPRKSGAPSLEVAISDTRAGCSELRSWSPAALGHRLPDKRHLGLAVLAAFGADPGPHQARSGRLR